MMEIEGNPAVLLTFLVASVTAVVASVFDFRRYCVPNRVVVPLCLSGLIFHTFAGDGLVQGLAGVAVGMGLLLPFFITGVMGAGDVKLLAAIGAWLGPISTLYACCVAGLIAGGYSVVVLVRQGRLHQIPMIVHITCLQLLTLGRHLASSEAVALGARRSDHRRYVLSFAVMIAVGVIAVAVCAATLG